jgi:hypothetical protein
MTELRRVASAEDAYLAHLANMPEEYLECRSTQHKMTITDPFRIVDSRAEEGAYPHMGNYVYAKRSLTCDRCGMVRHDFYSISSRRGHTYLTKINATYQPPEGYAVSGLGRVEGSRGLVLGLGLDITDIPVRGRGRPRKETG